MILSELRTYLTEHQRVALIDLAHRFDTDSDALRGMLTDTLVTLYRIDIAAQLAQGADLVPGWLAAGSAVLLVVLVSMGALLRSRSNPDQMIAKNIA